MHRLTLWGRKFKNLWNPRRQSLSGLARCLVEVNDRKLRFHRLVFTLLKSLRHNWITSQSCALAIMIAFHIWLLKIRLPAHQGFIPPPLNAMECIRNVIVFVILIFLLVFCKRMISIVYYSSRSTSLIQHVHYGSCCTQISTTTAANGYRFLLSSYLDLWFHSECFHFMQHLDARLLRWWYQVLTYYYCIFSVQLAAID